MHPFSGQAWGDCANEIFITVRVTVRAGNEAVTNFTVVLDYAGATNPPVVQLLWPLAGMAVSGSNVTLLLL